MKKNLIESIVIAVVATGLSYALGLVFHWIHTVNYLEAFAVFTSYSSTYLCVKERRINYLIGAISTAAYCVLFFQQGLLASAILNAYLTPSLAYGWFRWRADSDTRPVTRVAAKWIPVYLGVTGLAYVGVLWITHALGATMALTDSMILIGSILAQFLLDNKKIENWYVWMVVNGFAIYTYFAAGLPVAGLQYVAFFLNTFYGLIVWNRSRKPSGGWIYPPSTEKRMQNAKSLRVIDGAAADDGAPQPRPVFRVVGTDDGPVLHGA